MSEEANSNSAAIVRDLLSHAIPVNPTHGNSNGFITRQEFEKAMLALDGKIENAVLKQKLWVLSGILALMIAFGGGYISIIGKIDRLTETLPVVLTKLEARAIWMQRQERKDMLQDEQLHKMNKDYLPVPYSPTPS